MLKGTFNRAVMDLVSKSKPVVVETYFWGLAELMTFTWLFFEDIDFIKDPEGNVTQGFIVVIKPRRKILPNVLTKNPKILKILRKRNIKTYRSLKFSSYL